MREGEKIFSPSTDFRKTKFALIVAGEASADLHGSNLVKAIRRLDNDIEFCGIGGGRMEEIGVNILFSSSDMAVVGLTEVLYRLNIIIKALRKLKSIIKKKRPDLLILIDFPEFNIHLARTAKRFHVPVLYYVSPQVWAWRRSRVKKISRRIDRMAVILPFEKEFYRKNGMKVDYVGHPLLDAYTPVVNRDQVRVELGADRGYPVVGLLPGSREDEVGNLLPAMVESVEILGRKYPGIRCLLPLAPTIQLEFVRSLIKDSSVEIKVFQGDIHVLLSACHVAIVTSGTATLETAISGVPMVVVYRMSPLSYLVGRLIIKAPYISLVNLVAGEEVVTELIQDDVTPDRIADEVLNILNCADVRENMIKKLKSVSQHLGRGGASERAAGIALEMMV